jgi:hypothetical protein
MVVGHPTEADSTESGCFACAKHRGEQAVVGGAIYRDDLVYVSPAIPRDGTSATHLGYVIVETQRHAPRLGDLTAAEAQAVGACVVSMARALTALLRVGHVYTFVLGHEVRPSVSIWPAGGVELARPTPCAEPASAGCDIVASTGPHLPQGARDGILE